VKKTIVSLRVCNKTVFVLFGGVVTLMSFFQWTTDQGGTHGQAIVAG
jgi:hypothetical protein